MNPHMVLQLCDANGHRFFGTGPYRLLLGVEELGSLRAAAQSMGMAYSKAHHMIQTAESELGFPLTQRVIGGRGGGGSTLTEGARALMKHYEAYAEACDRAAQELFTQHFADFDPARYHTD